MNVRQAEAGAVIKAENFSAIRDTVEQRVKELITVGQLGKDGRLPTERNFAEQLGVSSTTLRQLDRLEHEDSVYRRRGGTGGTFVNRPRVDIDFGCKVGIPAYLCAQGFRPGAYVVSTMPRHAEMVGRLTYPCTGVPVWFAGTPMSGLPGSPRFDTTRAAPVMSSCWV